MTEIENGNLVACVMQGDKPIPIVAMWESFSGWYWYITEIDKRDKNYLFGLVHGFEDEWGYVDKRELLSLPMQIWQVPKDSWAWNSRVKLIPKSEIKIKAKHEGVKEGITT